MATTFHQFPLLPRELRDEIWYSAIRSHHQGVQIFQIHKSPSDEDNGHLSTSLIDHLYDICVRRLGLPFMASDQSSSLPMAGEHIRPWYFGAPLESKCYKGLDGSPDKNMSTYMIDSGLWTACKESRRVIRKHFANPSNNPWGRPERGRVSHCSGSNPFYFSIWPGSDLFILQTDNFFDTNCSRMEAFPGTPNSCPYPVESCCEIGIEYDSELTDSTQEHDLSRGSRDVSLTVGFLLKFLPKRRLWLVDTNLKRKAGAFSSHDSDTKQFYASDKKFVQVPLDKGADNLREWEYIHPVEGGNYWASSIYFASLANEEARNFWAPPGFTTINHGHRLEDQIGLLGWEDLKNS
ncbi:hypothetical protein FOVG_12912 [Fusarium oxysporum f. sp. pisi HDV247]|uniref:2EXR domain-containing protein n=1 Tax=Fusarium oxysporum f. sp. pisi HDV247 TaxID=1080344 RepID=W9NSL2_FUSOX|nr:hypothetical protein FOVG_12912 [Fusarium oxysporum f. sp. pisi HDV247]